MKQQTVAESMREGADELPPFLVDRIWDAVLSHLFSYFMGMVTTAAFVVIPRLLQ